MGDYEASYPVVLYVYDLSGGLARQLSTSLLGRTIEGIWHTSVVVYGLEYYYSGGIVKGLPNQSAYGMPVKVVDLGSTQVPKAVFEEYLDEISPRFTQQTYNLLKHNCNNFSNEVTQFLVGKEIPSYILRLPDEVMGTPQSARLLPTMQQMETSLRYGSVPQVPHLSATGAATAAAAASAESVSTSEVPPAVVIKSTAAAVPSVGETSNKDTKASTTTTTTTSKTAAAPSQGLESARARVQEEISREFAALMAAGGLRASEAAALAARRVMQKHGISAGVPSGAKPA